jgi:hypothetical protein
MARGEVAQVVSLRLEDVLSSRCQRGPAKLGRTDDAGSETSLLSSLGDQSNRQDPLEVAVC